MKYKLSLPLLLMLFGCLVHAQKTNTTNTFILKGTTTDPKTHVVWLTYSISKKQRIKQKAFVKRGAFLFTGAIASPVYAELYFNSKPLSNHDWGINEVLLSPGNMTIALTGDSTTNAVITGSAMQDDWFKIEKQKQFIKKAKYEIYGKMNEISRAGNTPKNHAAVMKLGSKLDKYNRQETEIDYKFISQNSNSYLSPYLTAYYFDSKDLKLDSAAMFYNSFSEPVKNSIAARSLHSNIVKHAVSARGGIAPLFTQKDANGKILDLKSFRGKNYVLLYFWASWALYKSDEGPHLVKLYNKYYGKGLDIIGVSQDATKKEWKNAITENGFGRWHNLITKYDNNLQAKYNIEGMPPSILILIDKKGKIVGRYMGEHVSWQKGNDNEGSMLDLDKALAETLGR